MTDEEWFTVSLKKKKKSNTGIKECARFIYLTNDCKATYKTASEHNSTWTVTYFVAALKKLSGLRIITTMPGGIAKI